MDGLIFAAVVAARVLVPLGIPRFPLPAMLAALVIDGLDQTIFQTFTSLDLSGYQQLRQGARRLLPLDRLHGDDAELDQPRCAST